MPTSSKELASLLLDSLDSHTKYAVIHGEKDLLTGGSAGDIDLLVDGPPARAVLNLVSSSGIRLVLVWPYATHGLASFWVGDFGHGGVHLDMVHDSSGRECYGLRTDVALGCRVASGRWPVADPVDRDLYLIVKRLAKGQPERLPQIAYRDKAMLLSRAEEVLNGAARDLVRSFLCKGLVNQRNYRLSRKPNAELMRIAHRIRKPIGSVITLPDAKETTIDLVASELGRTLVGVQVLRGASSRSIRSRVSALTARWGPMLVLTRHRAHVPIARATIPGDLTVSDAFEFITSILAGRATSVLESGHLQPKR